MRTPKRVLALVMVILVAALTVPAAAQAATIYVNSGVSGAKLGMNDKKAATKLGKVKKTWNDNEYGYLIEVRGFGTKSKSGDYSLYLYSNGKHKVTAFLIYSKRYVTKKSIHVGSTTKALKNAYKTGLHKTSDGYFLKSKTGRTSFETSDGKITCISVWKI